MQVILMFGDNHGHFDHIIEAVQRDRPAAIILLGDLECPRPLHELVAPIRDLTDIWFIHGNHDTDSAESYHNLFESELADRNLHGRVVEIAGIRAAGLGGIFRGEVWYPPDDPQYLDYAEYATAERGRPGKRRLTKQDLCRLQSVPGPQTDLQDLVKDGRLRKHRSSIFYRDYIDLYGQQADILLTHEAPSCHPHGFREIDALAQSLHVKFAFHGHHHDSLNYRAHDQRLGFQAFGVGFCGITDMYGGIIQPGDFDEARRYRQGHPVEASRPNGKFTLDASADLVSLIGADSRLDINLSTAQPGVAATQILEFLSGYHRVTILRDDEAKEVLFLALLGKRAPAHISFRQRGSDE